MADISLTKKSDSALKTRSIVERQREWRLKVFNSHRFQLWSEGSDGYESDDSTTSYASSLSADQLHRIDVLRELMNSRPVINSELVINTCVIALASQLEEFHEDDGESLHTIDKYFQPFFLSHIKSFIGVKTIGVSSQVNLLKMLNNLVTMADLSTTSIDNLITSLFIKRLVEVISFGSDSLAVNSLTLLMSCLDAGPPRPQLLVHMLQCGLVHVLYERTSKLKWRTPKIRDVKAPKRLQSVTATHLSLTTQKLFRSFSYAVSRIADFEMADSHRVELVDYMAKIYHRFLSCPDNQVVNNTIQSFVLLMRKNVENKWLMANLLKNFGETLLAMINTKDESLVQNILHFMSTIVENSPELLFAKVVNGKESFGSALITALDGLSDRRSSKLNREAILMLVSVAQWLDAGKDDSRQLSNRLFLLSLTMLKSSHSYDEYNIDSALFLIDTILGKLSFTSLVLSSSQARALLAQLIEKNDPNLLRGVTKIVGQLQTMIDKNRLSHPREALHVKNALISDVMLRMSAKNTAVKAAAVVTGDHLCLT